MDLLRAAQAGACKLLCNACATLASPRPNLLAPLILALLLAIPEALNAQATIHVPQTSPPYRPASTPPTTATTARRPWHLLREHRFQRQGHHRHQLGRPTATTVIDGGGLGPTALFERMSRARAFSPASPSAVVGSSRRSAALDPESPSFSAAPTIVNNIITNNGCHGVEVDSGGAVNSKQHDQRYQRCQWLLQLQRKWHPAHRITRWCRPGFRSRSGSRDRKHHRTEPPRDLLRRRWHPHLGPRGSHRPEQHHPQQRDHRTGRSNRFV